MLRKTHKTTIKRFPKRASYDLDSLKSVIKTAFIGHLAFQDANDTHSIPLLFWEYKNYLYCHCAKQSRLTKLVDNGQQVAISFAIVDGLVLAKSAPKHSANYRSAVVYGIFHKVLCENEKNSTLKALMELHHPGRWQQVIPATQKELAAVSLLKIDINEAVVKSRSGPPNDKQSDRQNKVWSGEIPLMHIRGLMKPDKATQTNNILRQMVQANRLCDAVTVSMMQGRYARLEKLDINSHSVPLFTALCIESDKKIWDYLPYRPYHNFDDFRDWLMKQAQDLTMYVICNHVTDQVLGLAAYLNSDTKHRAIEVGCVLYGEAMQKTRQATEAMYLMMRHAFDQGYRRYVWQCDALNQRSHQAALRLGFQFEGVWRQAMIVKGQNRDTAWHSVLDSEWSLLKKSFESWLLPNNFNAMGQQKKSLAMIRDGSVL